MKSGNTTAARKARAAARNAEGLERAKARQAVREGARRGPVPSADSLTELVQFRARIADVESYRTRAAAAGMPVQEWIRVRLAP